MFGNITEDIGKFVEAVEEEGFITTNRKASKILKKRVKNRVDDFLDSIKMKYNALKYDKVSKSDKYVYINPDSIEYYLMNSKQTYDKRKKRAIKKYIKKGRANLHKLEKGRFSPSIFTGLILPGRWDLYKKPYKFDRVYKGLKKYYEDNETLEKTEYMYQYKLRGVIREENEYLERQIEKKKKLYETIKEGGYKTQYELNIKKDNMPIYKLPWSITVNVDRNGKFIYNNTAHNRLAISRILGIKKIPVLVIVWHKKYIDWVKENTDIDKITTKTAIKPILDGRVQELKETATD